VFLVRQLCPIPRAGSPASPHIWDRLLTRMWHDEKQPSFALWSN